ncbi:MAG: ATP-binding protein, partial [Myxococcales bacterium]|nr:ATP-binding protein [Myxococcales bacterium]
REGLGRWGQDGERIRRLREAAEVSIFTPGSTTGRPLNVLRSFSAPTDELAADEEALADRIRGAVSGLLAMLGITPDPIRSREHILLSSILAEAWKRGSSPDLAGLIRAIQAPPFQRVGVFELETFYPAAERLDFAMQLNNLLASPGFESWLAGEPLEVGRLLFTPTGKPRLAVLSIAHLSDAERMFFVTILLNEVIAWMRAQPGTQSLRALLYMDEVFGYFPPTANPPSKTPMLTLLKQARAYGLGVVLATQNPVDLDYKGLSNTGTWFLGRLQTERDKARVLDGLEGASQAAGQTFERAAVEAQLSGLAKRAFLVSNAHEDAPALIHTRWAMSYLRGPLTREQLRSLQPEPALEGAAPEGSQPGAAARADAEPASRPTTASPPSRRDAPGALAERPVVPPALRERFLATAAPTSEEFVYRPALLAQVDLHYADRSQLDHWETRFLLARLSGANPRGVWRDAQSLGDLPDFDTQADPGARFDAPPGRVLDEKTFRGFGKQLTSFCYRSFPLELWRSARPKGRSRPGESEGAFLGRLQQLQREARDAAMEKLRRRFAPKLARLAERIRKTEARVEREEEQYRQSRLQSAISIGATLMGALFGRKLGSVGNVGRASTAAKSVGRARRERGDISRAEQDLEASREELAALEEDFEARLEDVRLEKAVDRIECEAFRVRPRKSDTSVAELWFVWEPWSFRHGEPAASLARLPQGKNNG